MDKNVDIEINPDYTMLKNLPNGLKLSQEQIDILKHYNINYLNCKSLNDLIYKVELVYDETDDVVLNNLLDVLSERDYYENYPK
ncbi:MAG TPA: hypothetical protein PLB45_00325 [Bacilli bacterium]|jgi:hypothetical protein|nr:hypothetical protein [Bacilli bacterium]HPZ23956.1 hypothetical protein [Bacilli bacterium]HQC83307.1 hypothetical protein [Bacilli bacterium]